MTGYHLTDSPYLGIGGCAVIVAGLTSVIQSLKGRSGKNFYLREDGMIHRTDQEERIIQPIDTNSDFDKDCAFFFINDLHYEHHNKRVITADYLTKKMFIDTSFYN